MIRDVTANGTRRAQWPVADLAAVQGVSILAELQELIAGEANDTAVTFRSLGEGQLLQD